MRVCYLLRVHVCYLLHVNYVLMPVDLLVTLKDRDV